MRTEVSAGDATNGIVGRVSGQDSFVCACRCVADRPPRRMAAQGDLGWGETFGSGRQTACER